jgi:hypothetical protein
MTVTIILYIKTMDKDKIYEKNMATIMADKVATACIPVGEIYDKTTL